MVTSRDTARATTPSAVPNGSRVSSSPCTTAASTGAGTCVPPVTMSASSSSRAPDVAHLPAGGPGGRRRSGPRPPARATGRSPEAGPAARPRPARSRRLPTPRTPAARRRAPGRGRRPPTAAANRRPAPRRRAPPATRPRPRSSASRADWCGADGPGRAPRGLPRWPPPRLVARPAGPADRSRQPTLADRSARSTCRPQRSAVTCQRRCNGR